MNTLALLPNKQALRRRPKRVASLAVLPVFFKLQGKKVIVAGGTDAAAWKAELLAASGATVEVFAPSLSTTFREIIAANPHAFNHHQSIWSETCFAGAVLCICDAASEREAQDFYGAAMRAGVPVNVIDKPNFCQFQFGSIINRSPAIISISTDGAAPILGQAIRRRIETVLPPGLKIWAQLARDIRIHVNQRLAIGTLRRKFWERFVDRAFSAEVVKTTKHEMLDDILQLGSGHGPNEGKITLVGAGPGEADLLTLKAVRALQSADIIMFDDQVSDDVLELARREARRMLVGESQSCETCKHEETIEIMVKLAKAGKNVVRLRFADPASSADALAEMFSLEQRGFSVGIIPGISSAGRSIAPAPADTAGTQSEACQNLVG